MRNAMRSGATLAAAMLVLLTGSSCQPGSIQLGPDGKKVRTLSMAEIDRKLAQYVQVEMAFDATGLPRPQRELLRKLIEAGEMIERAFWAQAFRDGWKIRKQLEGSDDPRAAKLHHLLLLNAIPFDRFNEFEPFLGESERPAGAGFYPEDLTKEELEAYIGEHPEQKEALLNPYTVVHRQGERLNAVPFHVEYRKWVEPASQLLFEASQLARNRSLKKFLRSRSVALLTDNYYQSDLDWIDLRRNTIELVFGPYETYEDHLMGVKAAYEATIAVKDPEESERLQIYVKNLNALEQNLPIDGRFKRGEIALDSPMVVVTDIFRGGDIGHGYQPVAANLPNDPRVHEAKGTKKTFWKNMMKARLEKIIQPMAREILAEDQLDHMTGQAYFNVVLMHEIAHALGPRWIGEGGDRRPVTELLQEEYSAIEEGKADVAGLVSLEWFMDREIIPASLAPQHYVSYLGGLFRSIRFGITEAHGKASMIAINWHREREALVYDSGTGRWRVDFDKIPDSIRELARELLMIEATGDYERSRNLSEKYAVKGPDVEATLERVDDLPIDIEPIYSVKWE